MALVTSHKIVDRCTCRLGIPLSYLTARRSYRLLASFYTFVFFSLSDPRCIIGLYIIDNKVADDMCARPQYVKVNVNFVIYMAVVNVCAINNELCVNERGSVYVLQRFIFRFIIFLVSTATHPITRRFARPEPSSFVVIYNRTYLYSYTFVQTRKGTQKMPSRAYTTEKIYLLTKINKKKEEIKK